MFRAIAEYFWRGSDHAIALWCGTTQPPGRLVAFFGVLSMFRGILKHSGILNTPTDSIFLSLLGLSGKGDELTGVEKVIHMLFNRGKLRPPPPRGFISNEEME